MDCEVLKNRAERLYSLLKTYAATDAEAANLQFAIGSLIERAMRGEIVEPIPSQEILGDRLISEGWLTVNHPDLTHAFAEFKIEATGGPPPALLAMQARRGI